MLIVASQRSASPHSLRAILFCFFISGAAGLIYQVAWVKALTLIFGHSLYAVAAVIAAFMGGLAAGSAYLYRFARTGEASVTFYARIEFLICLTGAVSLLGLQGVHSLYLTAYPLLSDWKPVLFGLRLICAAFVLLIPTFLMGGTFPVLASGLADRAEGAAAWVSQLYWVNTAGGVMGAVLAGFVLLPIIGLRLTIGAAAALNLVAGLAALRFGGGRIFREKAKTPDSKLPVGSKGLLWLFGLVGGSALAFEVAWTRMLAVTIGSSTYGFTLILSGFLAGIAIGSALFHWSNSRSKRPSSIGQLCWAQLTIGLAALLSLILYHWIPNIISPLLDATNRTFGGLLLTQFVTATCTIVPTSIALGFNFPLVVALLSRSGVGVGKAYAANTVGAIAGSLAAGFLLIPYFGSFRVIVSVAVVNLLLAAAVQIRLQKPRPLLLAGTLAMTGAAVFLPFSSLFYDRALLSFAPVLYGRSYHGSLTLAEIAATKELVFATEGVNDSVTVVRTDGDLALRINGKIDASTQDSRTQLLLGHLPAALHNRPRRVLIIGFGSGMTVSAVSRYPDIERIDCVEIEPAVLRAAPYLTPLNRDVLKDARVHIVIDDARDFLFTSRDKYDIIISEPSNPWIAGVASLFTKEYYAAARQRLASDGIFVQWLQAYSLAPADMRMIVATFAGQFPNVTLWRAGETDLMLVGRSRAVPIQFDRLRSLWTAPGLREDFKTLNISEPAGIVAYFLLDDRGVRQLASGSVVNTDDLTLLEYDAPRTLLSSNLIDQDHDLVRLFREGALPKELAASEGAHALAEGLTTALDMNDAAGAKDFLNASKPNEESAGYEVAQGRLALMQSELPQAQQFFEAALRLNAGSPEALYWLATAEQRAGDEASAFSRIEEALQANPNSLPALEEYMVLSAGRKDFESALSAQRKRMALISNPPAYEYGRLGTLLMETANLTEAEGVLLKGLTRDPYCYACHFELGELYARENKLTRAREHLQWVVRFFPDAGADAFRLLVAIDLTTGDRQAARKALDEGLRLFPDEITLQQDQKQLGSL